MLQKFILFVVLLSPFGLKGTITGRTYSTLDGSREMLKEWNHFYPIHLNSDSYSPKSQSQGNEPVPPVVEVVLDKVCMKYPACYVLVPVPVNPKVNIEKVLDFMYRFSRFLFYHFLDIFTCLEKSYRRNTDFTARLYI